MLEKEKAWVKVESSDRSSPVKVKSVPAVRLVNEPISIAVPFHVPVVIIPVLAVITNPL